MKTPNLTFDGTTLLLGGLALAAVWWFVKGGGARATTQAVISGVGNVAGGVARGAVDGVSETVGLPTTSETTTDPAVARWIIDNFGYWEASKWSGVPALTRAAMMDQGSGKPPPVGSAIERALGIPQQQETPAPSWGW